MSRARSILALAALACLVPSSALASWPERVGVGLRVDEQLGAVLSRAEDPERTFHPATLYVPVVWKHVLVEPELLLGVGASDSSADFPGGAFESASTQRSVLGAKFGAFWRLEREHGSLLAGARAGARRTHALRSGTVEIGDSSSSSLVETSRIDWLASISLGAELDVTTFVSVGLEARLEAEWAADTTTRLDPPDPDAPTLTTSGFSLRPELAVILRLYLF